MLRQQPDEVIAWTDRRLQAGYVAMAVAGVTALVLLARVITNGDEYIYAGEARMLLHGRLVPAAGDPFQSANDFLGPRFPPGWPLMLSVGAAWSFRGMFFVAMLIHLLGGAAMARMMARRGLPSILAAVWLFHPLFWSFSRTLMSDVPSASLLLIAMDAWENRAAKTTALSIGFAFLVRMASFTHVSGFFLAIAHVANHRRRAVAVLCIGVGSALAILVTLNVLKFGHWLQSPYAKTTQGLLTASMLKENFLIYLLGLLLIPPFPLACILLRPRSCDRWILIAAPVVLFFICYGYRDVSPRPLESFFVGQRLILAAHAACLVGTASVWSRIPYLRSARLLLPLGVAGAVLQYRVSDQLERRYAPAAQAMIACHPKKIGFNEFSARVALSVDASSYYPLDTDAPPDLPDVAVISLRQSTNRYETSAQYKVPDWLLHSSAGCQRVGHFFIFDLTGKCPVIGSPCGSDLETHGNQLQ